MKVSELEGAELDYWVARAMNIPVRWEFREPIQGKRGRLFYDFDNPAYRFEIFWPSADWSQGGPLIEGYRICIQEMPPTIKDDARWNAALTHEWINETQSWGPTPLIAAMRALVASVYGEEVDD